MEAPAQTYREQRRKPLGRWACGTEALDSEVCLGRQGEAPHYNSYLIHLFLSRFGGVLRE